MLGLNFFGQSKRFGGKRPSRLRATSATLLVRAVHLVQMVGKVHEVSLDDMHSENIWFTWSKPSDY